MADSDSTSGGSEERDRAHEDGDSGGRRDEDRDADEGGHGDASAPAVDAIRGGPHDRATVTAADAATADRLAALEQQDAVEEYVPLVDYDALGLRTALLRIDAHHGNAESVADDLRDGPGVAVYLIVGRFDVLAVCRFPTTAAFERTATRLASDPRVRAHRVAVARHAVVEDGPLAALADEE
ncbi:MAG: Lrp/AsnC family transcriptional regulator [Haloglomus sp.]